MKQWAKIHRGDNLRKDVQYVLWSCQVTHPWPDNLRQNSDKNSDRFVGLSGSQQCLPTSLPPHKSSPWLPPPIPSGNLEHDNSLTLQGVQGELKAQPTNSVLMEEILLAKMPNFSLMSKETSFVMPFIKYRASGIVTKENIKLCTAWKSIEMDKYQNQINMCQ